MAMTKIILFYDQSPDLIPRNTDRLTCSNLKSISMKNILVPVDFSTYAMSAARSAAAIASRTGGTIHLLNIADIPVGWEHLPVSEQLKYPDLKRNLDESKAKIDKFAKLTILKDCKVISHVRGGVASEQLNLYADPNKISLMVMGAHGAGESDAKFLGSTAQRVVRTANCPVLSVKKGFSLDTLGNILFASDFDEDVTAIIPYLKNLAAAFGATIYFGYINTPGRFVDDHTMESRFQKVMKGLKGDQYKTIIQNSNEKEDGILDCAKRIKAGMIVMATHLRKQKPSYQVGVTESVLFKSSVPVMSFVLNESYRKKN